MGFWWRSALALAMFGNASLTNAVIAVGQAYALMLFLPFSIANMGVREYAFGLYLVSPAFGGSSPEGIACLGASLTIMVFNMALPALAGVIWELLHNR